MSEQSITLATDSSTLFGAKSIASNPYRGYFQQHQDVGDVLPSLKQVSGPKTDAFGKRRSFLQSSYILSGLNNPTLTVPVDFLFPDSPCLFRCCES